MYEAIVGYQWASSALTNCYTATPPWNFDRLCYALSVAWLQEQRRTNAQTEPVLTANTPSIMWESQRSYGKPKGQTNRSKNWTTNPYKRNIRDIKCWNCNEKGRYATTCPKSEKNVMKNVHHALKRNPNNTEKILFELCYAFDNAQSSSSSSSSSSESDHEENIVSQLQNHDDKESDDDSEDF